MTKIKILYIISTLKSCGPVNVLFNITKYLDQEQFEPTILTISPEPANSKKSQFLELNIPVYSLNLSRWEHLFKGKSMLKDFVVQHSPDVVHTHGIRADTLSVQCLSKYSRVTTIHNYPQEDYPLTYGKILGWYMAEKHIKILRQIDFPVAVSESVAKSDRFADFQVHAIPNGTDTSIYFPATLEEKLALRHRLGLSEKQTIFVSVGHLSSRKDPTTVIRGFLASEAKNNSLLLFLGDGQLRQQCEEITSSENCIRFLGKVDNVVDYLKAADFFISASRSEGIGYAILEALACGLPVCLSDIQPFQEIINYDRLAGVLFPVGNSDRLAAKINELIFDQNLAMRSKVAINLVQNHFDAQKMSEQYQAIYRKRNEG